VADERIIARATPAGTRRLAPIAPDARAAPARPVGPARQLAGLNGFLENARRQGAVLISVAREQADSIAQTAHDHGFETGYAEGISRAEAATATMLMQARALVDAAAEHRERVIENAERDLVRLSLGVAEKVLQASLEIDPDRVVGVLRGALRRTFARREVTVMCHPGDLARLQEAGPDLAATLGGLQSLEFISDRRIDPGGVIVRTEAGDVDATLASQLDRLRDVLLGPDADPLGDA
jgi:flagellar assembly protein FliH